MERIAVTCMKVDLEVDSFPLNSESVDAITLTEVIEHLWIDPLFALAEMNRCLKHGGTLLVTTPNLLSLRNRVNFLLGRIDHVIEHPFVSFYKYRRQGHFGHLRLYAPQELATLLRLFGFETQFYYRSIDYSVMVRVPWSSDPTKGQAEIAQGEGNLRLRLMRKFWRSPEAYWSAGLATGRHFIEKRLPRLRPHLFVIARKTADADFDRHSTALVRELVESSMMQRRSPSIAAPRHHG